MDNLFILSSTQLNNGGSGVMVARGPVAPLDRVRFPAIALYSLK